MNRFVTVVAATAVAAAVAAAITIPAGADQQPSDQPDATFVNCLRDHGAGIPADTRGDAIGTWVRAHDSDPAVMGAVGPCKAKAAGDVSPPDLVACLRDHGLNPPATVGALKPWIAGQFDIAASRPALHACGFAQGPTEKKPGDAAQKRAAICGGDPSPAPKPDDGDAAQDQ